MVFQNMNLVMDRPLRPPTVHFHLRRHMRLCLVSREFNRLATLVFYPQNTFVASWTRADWYRYEGSSWFFTSPSRQIGDMVRRLEAKFCVDFERAGLEEWLHGESDWRYLLGVRSDAVELQKRIEDMGPFTGHNARRDTVTWRRDVADWQNFFVKLDRLKITLENGGLYDGCLHKLCCRLPASRRGKCIAFSDHLLDAQIALRAKHIEVVVHGLACGNTCPYRCMEVIKSTISNMITDSARNVGRPVDTQQLE
jgi:hypothetical protein